MRTASDVVLAAFFALNVPLVLFIDAAAVLPPRFFPSVVTRLLEWYIRTAGDYLMRDKPAFFRGLVLAEILFQLPLYIVNAYAFFTGTLFRCVSLPVSDLSCRQELATTERGRVRSAYSYYNGRPDQSIYPFVELYPMQVPILYDIACSQAARRAVLFMIYVPYLIIPLIVFARLLPEVYYALESKAKSKAN